MFVRLILILSILSMSSACFGQAKRHLVEISGSVSGKTIDDHKLKKSVTVFVTNDSADYVPPVAVKADSTFSLTMKNSARINLWILPKGDYPVRLQSLSGEKNQNIHVSLADNTGMAFTRPDDPFDLIEHLMFSPAGDENKLLKEYLNDEELWERLKQRDSKRTERLRKQWSN